MSERYPPRGDLRRRVQAGEPTVGVFVGLGAPAAAEIVARAGSDWAILDLEHGLGSVAELHAQLLAVQSTPTAAIVRVPSVERLRIDRALDMGADGVMLPQVRTVVEARDGVSWMRYPPAGVRGVALVTRGAGYGATDHPDLAGRVNESLLGVFQVESPEAVAAADELAEIDGVDVLFVGPADLSHAMGIPGQITHSEFTAALDRVIAACRRHGKAAGILLKDGASVAASRERGFTFLGVGSDVSFVIGGARRELDAARSALGPADA
jgi:2-keto-3-deoxy-L-rhamnonate aldolase RhmA